MVVTNDGLIPVLQRNLGFQDEQEVILIQSNTLVSRNRKYLEEHRRISFSLDNEEAKVKNWDRIVQ